MRFRFRDSSGAFTGVLAHGTWALFACILLGSSACRGPSSADPRLPRAEAYTRAEAWEEAAGLWTAIFRASGGQDLRAGLESAKALDRSGLLGVSRTRLMELESRFPDSAEVHEALGFAHERAGEPEEARLSFERALALEPMRPRSVAGAGVLAAESEGEADGGVETLARLRESGQLGAVDAAVLARLGTAAAEAGAFDEAFAALQAAWVKGELAASEVVAAARSLAPDPRTIPWLEALVRDDPLHTEALTLLGLAQLRTGRTNLAVATLESAASSDPSDHRAMRAYAEALTAAGRSGRAEKIWAAIGEAPPVGGTTPPPGSSP